MRRDPNWTGVYCEHAPVVCDTGGPSRTRQEFAAECDINTIMARYERTGVVSHVAARPPAYLDLSDVPDLMGALAVLEAAGAAFDGLPAHIRREFDNDVPKFVAFAEDPANIDRLREWGLAEPLPVPGSPLPQAVSDALLDPAEKG